MTKQLFFIGPVPDANTPLVQASQSTRTIDMATVANVTGSAATLSVHIVVAGDSAADDVAIYKDLSIDGGQTVTLWALINQCIPSGATVSAVAGTASALTLTISGRTA